MADALLHGMLLGLLLSSLIGPIFFMLIETSLGQGYRKALMFDLGVLLSDVSCIFVAYYGTSGVLQNINEKPWFFYLGGVVFMAFGIFRFFQKPLKAMRTHIKKTSYTRLFVKGFVFNVANPSVLLFWLATCALAISMYETNGHHVFMYFSGILLTMLFFDQVKIILARQFKKKVTPARMFRINQLVGLLFFIFGLLLIGKTVAGY